MGRIDLGGASHVLRPGTHANIPAGVQIHMKLGRGARGAIISATETFLRSRVMPVLYVPSPEHWRRFGVPHVYRYAEGDENAAKRERVHQELRQAAERMGGPFDAAVVAYAFVIISATVPAGVQRTIEPESERDLGAAQLVMRFSELIEHNFREHLTIEDYAQMMAVTPVRLARACKSIMQRTPLSLIHERIIVEAKSELSFTRRSVAEIAYGLGFTDAAYFNRFFKQQTGEPPLQFRRSTAPAERRLHSAGAPA